MKKFKKILIVIPIIAILMCSICLPVSAATGTVYSMPISQPPVGDTYGYIEVLAKNSTGYGVCVYMYAMSNATDTTQLNIKASSTSITFEVYDTQENYGIPAVHVYLVRDTGTTKLIGSSTISVSDSFSSGIAGIHVYGNMLNFIANGAFTSQPAFTVAYGSDAASYNVLVSILAAINSQSNADIIANANQNADEIQQNANQNASDIQQNADQNASDIQQNDDENTQAIINNQNQLAEQEKQEVTGSGNDSVDSATEAIPDYDFFEAIGVFVDSLGSTDTECVIDIPRIYIPKVAMIPETTLYKGGTFNFNTVIDMIPDKILLLVQYILTAALIIYGCKEFYNLIFKSVDGVSKIGDDT